MKIIEKPWGREVLVACNDRYALKDIHMIAGTRSSLQSHRRKVETIFVISGRVSVERAAPGEPPMVETFGPGEAYDVAPGTIHRVTVLEDARLIEASTPELDDLIRHEDDFGRTSA
jgi:mannose-6-phosphate isomerase